LGAAPLQRQLQGYIWQGAGWELPWSRWAEGECCIPGGTGWVLVEGHMACAFWGKDLFPKAWTTWNREPCGYTSVSQGLSASAVKA